MTASAIWVIAGFLFFGIEILTLTFVLCFFGVGAFIAAIAALLGAEPAWQILFFAAGSLLTLFCMREKLRVLLSGHSRKAPPPLEHPLAGRAGIVSRPINPGETGEISIDGSFWRAVADDVIPEGCTVRVTGHKAGDELVLCVSATPKISSEE